VRFFAVDTATEACSVALWQDGDIIERFEVAGRGHTERLLPMAQALLADAGCAFAAVDAFVCGVGPGSFAGVRIGVGFVKGLALALDRPVLPTTSLEMLAQRAMNHGSDQVLAAIDARMDEVYFGAFRKGRKGLAETLGAALVARPNEVPPVAEGSWTAVGSAWRKYEIELKQAVGATIKQVDGAALPHAADALEAAAAAFQSGKAIAAADLAPVYLRDKVALNLAEQAALRRSREAADGS
jgi:tRNA threonylcarbamoyladenosine biosynthesis protein TsaB